MDKCGAEEVRLCQFSCRSLGMCTIFVHRYSGVLSAVGIGLAEVVAEEQVSRLCRSPTGFLLDSFSLQKTWQGMLELGP